MANGVADSAVGAILEISPSALQDIQKAERYITNLQITSKRASEAVSSHWGSIATAGLGTFIQRLADAQEKMKLVSGGKIDFNINTNQATQNVNSASKQIDADMRAISATIQTIAQSFDFSNVEASVKNLINTFGQVESTIRNTNKVRREFATDDPEVNRYNRLIEVLKEYVAQKKKSQESVAVQNRQQAESDLNRLYTERLRLLKEKEQLENKALVNTAKGLPDLTAKENQLLAEVTAKIQQIERQIQNIGNTYAGLAAKTKHAFALDELRQATDLQNQFNKALDAVDTSRTKQLVAEYKRLYAENQKIIGSLDAANKLGAGVMTPQAYQTYNKLFNDQTAIITRMAEIERKNIQEIADFRQQKEMEANHRSLSEFVQAEAQKTAEAKRQAEQQSNARIEAYQKFLNTYQGAMAAANRLGTRGGWEDTYENRARVIKNLEAAVRSLKTTDADYERQLHNLTTALNNLKNKQKEVDDAMKSQPKPNVADAQWLAQVARGTKTLEDYKRAYDVLIEVMSRTPKNSTDFKNMSKDAQDMKRNIEEVEKSMEKLHDQSKQTSNVMGQLQSRIAAAFSVGAIMGFIKKMVEVRAQFELQRVALGAIIQDRDEANKIFTQVQNMALESPFNIMQLEKATKQIAAFGFETQKLVPTMKMFADISAGLGVEIDRLVLVMGHLKARNFLEGTMVRQFTNMGFNVLGELSKYYQELEGKMVSVGEVQDRVKKKMVSFEDVEEVLKRVTSAGGMFYDMQKKQSESLWGQMQRIQDAYDLMLNEIGQANEGVLKSALTTIRNLINHWRDLKPVIVATVAAMGAYFTTALALKGIPLIIGNIVNGFRAIRTAIMSATVANNALNTSMMKNPWGALLGLITAVGVAIYEVATTQSKLNEELGRIEDEGLGNMYNLIFQYRQLADTIKDTNKTYEERKEAMDEMKRVYGEILPDQMLEIDNIKQMKDGYNEATEAIKAHYEEKIKRQKEEAIKGEYEKKIKEQVEDAAERFKLLTYDAITEGMGIENIPEETYQRNIQNILTAITKEVENGITPAEEASNRFKEVLMNSLAMTDADYKKISQSINLDKAFEDAFSHQEYIGNRFGGAWIENSILSTLREESEKFKEETENFFGNLNAFMAPEAEPYVKQYEALTQAVNKYKQAIEALFELQSNGELYDKDGKLTDMGRTAYADLLVAIENINNAGQTFGVNFEYVADDVNNAIQSNIDKMEYFEKVNVQTFGHVTSSFESWGEKLQNNTFIKGLVENWKKAWESLNLSDEQREIRNLIKTVGELNNVDLSEYKWALIDSKDNVASVAKEVKAEVESLKTSIQKYQTAVAHGLPAMIASAFFLGGKTLEEVQQTVKAVDELSHKLGNADKATKKSGGKGNDPWQQRLSLFKELNTEYEKLLKNYSEEESKQRIQLSYAKAVAEIFKGQGKFGDINNWLGFDKESMIEIGQQMLDTLSISPEKRKDMEKQLAGLKAEVDVHIQEDAVKEMEKYMQKVADNFELSEIFRKLGVPIELTYSLGGKPTTLADQRRELENNYYQTFKVQKKYGEEGEKAYDKIQQDIAKKEQKNFQERAKNYVKYLTESMGERARIEIKAIRDVNKIEEDATLDNFSKQQAIMERRKKMYEDLAKFDLGELKGSDVYLTVFKDLESASKEQLQYVLNKLRELQSTFKDLSPAQVKAIANEMKKIEDALADKDSVKNLYDNLKESIKFAKNRNALLREQVNLRNQIDRSGQKLSDAQTELFSLQLKLNGIQDQNSDEWKEANDAVKKQQIYIAGLQSQIEWLKNKLKEVTGEINKGTQAWEGFRKGLDVVAQFTDATIQAIDDIYNGLDSAFNLDDATRDTFESISDILGGISNTIHGLSEIDVSRPFTIISGLGKAIGGIFSTIGGIFGIGDKKKEREIKRLTEKVEELDKAYQRLEKSIESAYTFSDYNAGYKQMQDALAAEKTAYEEMIRLEEAKKKSDKDKIKEYQDKLDEIAEKEEELRQKRHEMYGSTDDVWGEANNWIDAWLDVFKEYGTGLDSLNDSWDEFYENLVKKQATSAIVGKRMQDYIDRINKVIDSNMDEYGYVDAFKTIGEKFKSEFGDLNKKLIDFFNYAGITGGNGELILSDLQKGIQNITEPQAAAIEAYLNSMRFAVFRHTEQLDTLIATIQMQYGSGAENPVVTELKGIRGVLDNIDRRLASVINTQGRNATLRIGAN